MFKLDIHVFKTIYDYCHIIGTGFGFGAFEGFFINAIAVVGVILVGLNNKGASKKW